MTTSNAPGAGTAPTRELAVFFRARGERCAIRAKDVNRVVGGVRVCRLPRLPHVVLGIAHHRGRIVTVVDAGALLFPEADPIHRAPSDQRLLILERQHRHVALQVELVEEIEPLRFQSEGGSTPVGFVASHRAQAVHALDTDRLFEAILSQGKSGLAEAE